MPTYKVTLEYDGTNYAGWQRQPDQPTIQGAVEAAIRTVAQADIPVIAAGRTDAGVHALGQVVSFRLDKEFPTEELSRAFSGLLPADISARQVARVADDFHARYGAREKLYEYRILHRHERSALERARAWHIHGRLDVDAMREGAHLLTGCHDFASFQGSPTDTENTICDLRQLELIQQDPLIRIEVLADRFLKQMVRAIVGTLVEVGQGKRAPQAVKDILDARDRRAAGLTAPPHGLYLVSVTY